MPDLAKQFSREEIIDAIEYIDENQIDLIGSTVHLLEYNGNLYPPKEVVRWAAKLKNLKDWENYRLSGGDNTNEPLKALGFSFTKKADLNQYNQSVNKAIIDQYKLLIREGGNQDELYKFYLIEDFRNKWNIDAEDFTKMFLSIDFKNLIYHPIALTTLRNIASKDPEFLRETMKALFDEQIGLNNRIDAFCSSLNSLYKSWNPKLQGGIDERTVATLMTLHDPSKYTFYKWTFYNEWCKKLGLKGSKTGECYFDYLEKVDDLIDNYIVDDEELLLIHQTYLKDSLFKDENYYILAQDIIYQVLEQLPKRKITKDYKVQFQNWLTAKTKDTSNKVSSYMQALIILSELVNDDVFKVSDREYLQDLYKDLVQEQRKENGKYYYSKSPSYGNNGYFSAAINEYLLFHSELLNQEISLNSKNMIDSTSFPLNQILYGPPGTGKTYHTINKAVAIANPTFDLKQPRAIIKGEYKRLVEAGHIVFTTFHQSMSYEDFVEGIKPVMDNENSGGQINYAVEDGIFKAICMQASLKDVQKDDSIDWSKKDYFKLSLGGVARPDVHDYCLDHNIIALGYGGEKDLSNLSTITDWIEFKIKFLELNPEEYKETTYSAQAAFTFLRMNIGDVVVISKGNKIVDAIGIVESNYYFDDNVSIDYKHFRKVKWLSTRMNYKPDFFLDVNISQMTIYEFYKHNIKVEAFKELFSSSNTIETPLKPHILIIDEINRGNVSAIFGELITLIEDSKREDQPEALEVILPYSKEKFSVPPNLYIIGTMNTADRSVEALDTALRRRFVFEEILPNPDLEEMDYEVFGYNVSDILKRINLRIEKLVDRDHCIGHAYFIGKNEETIIDSFYKNIIPLLQEYFFGDYGKIGLVLGKGFIRLKQSESALFADFSYEYKEDLESRTVYEIIDYRNGDIDTEGFGKAISALMNNG